MHILLRAFPLKQEWLNLKLRNKILIPMVIAGSGFAATELFLVENSYKQKSLRDAVAAAEVVSSHITSIRSS